MKMIIFIANTFPVPIYHRTALRKHRIRVMIVPMNSEIKEAIYFKKSLISVRIGVIFQHSLSSSGANNGLTEKRIGHRR